MTVVLGAVTGFAFFKYNGMFPLRLALRSLRCVVCRCRGVRHSDRAIFAVGFFRKDRCRGRTCRRLPSSSLERGPSAADEYGQDCRLSGMAVRPGDAILDESVLVASEFQEVLSGTGLLEDRADRSQRYEHGVARRRVLAQDHHGKARFDPANVGTGPIHAQPRAPDLDRGRYRVATAECRPSRVGPAPHPQFGWDNNAYTQIWSMHLAHFLQHHATSLTPVNR